MHAHFESIVGSTTSVPPNSRCSFQNDHGIQPDRLDFRLGPCLTVVPRKRKRKILADINGLDTNKQKALFGPSPHFSQDQPPCGIEGYWPNETTCKQQHRHRLAHIPCWEASFYVRSQALLKKVPGAMQPSGTRNCIPQFIPNYPPSPLHLAARSVPS